MFYTIFLGTLLLLRFWSFLFRLLVCFFVVVFNCCVRALAKSENFMFNDIKNNLMRINNIMSTKFCSFLCYVLLLVYIYIFFLFRFVLFVCCESFFYFYKKKNWKIPSHKQLFFFKKQNERTKKIIHKVV